MQDLFFDDVAVDIDCFGLGFAGQEIRNGLGGDEAEFDEDLTEKAAALFLLVS